MIAHYVGDDNGTPIHHMHTTQAEVDACTDYGPKKTEVNGTECFNCSFVSEEERFSCPSCGAEEVGPVTIEPCDSPDYGDGDGCESDFHHYGRGDHVRTVER